MWRLASALRLPGPVSGAISSSVRPARWGDVDDRQPVQHVVVVAALTGDTLGLWEHAHALVEADVRRVHAGPHGNLADRQPQLVIARR